LGTRHRERALLPAFAAACLLSLSASAAQTPSLVGFWLGEGQPNVDGRIVYVSEIRPDGTFRSEFRKYENCRPVETNIETGTWTLTGDVQEMITTSVNGRTVSFSNVFTIERLTAVEQHARMQKNGYLFVETRLPRFEFPPCQNGA
jgi:hypothetical protein